MTAQALILAGYGLNCEEETQYAFEHVGFNADIIHINDLIDTPEILEKYQLLTIPGGFSYGDDTGSGNAFAQKIKLALWEPLQKFIARDTLVIGICNGCQILTNLGLIPAFEKKYGSRDIAVTHNKNARYQCRWVDLKTHQGTSPWLQNIQTMNIPVAHGEGRFMMSDKTLQTLKENNQIALSYIKPDGNAANCEFPFNPNGAIDDIAALTDESGKILAIMPHPERGMFTWQRPDYDVLKDRTSRENTIPSEESDGMKIFKNAAIYFDIAKQDIKAA